MNRPICSTICLLAVKMSKQFGQYFLYIKKEPSGKNWTWDKDILIKDNLFKKEGDMMQSTKKTSKTAPSVGCYGSELVKYIISQEPSLIKKILELCEDSFKNIFDKKDISTLQFYDNIKSRWKDVMALCVPKGIKNNMYEDFNGKFASIIFELYKNDLVPNSWGRFVISEHGKQKKINREAICVYVEREKQKSINREAICEIDERNSPDVSNVTYVTDVNSKTNIDTSDNATIEKIAELVRNGYSNKQIADHFEMLKITMSS